MIVLSFILGIWADDRYLWQGTNAKNSLEYLKLSVTWLDCVDDLVSAVSENANFRERNMMFWILARYLSAHSAHRIIFWITCKIYTLKIWEEAEKTRFDGIFLLKISPGTIEKIELWKKSFVTIHGKRRGEMHRHFH